MRLSLTLALAASILLTPTIAINLRLVNNCGFAVMHNLVKASIDLNTALAPKGAGAILGPYDNMTVSLDPAQWPMDLTVGQVDLSPSTSKDSEKSSLALHLRQSETKSGKRGNSYSIDMQNGGVFGIVSVKPGDPYCQWLLCDKDGYADCGIEVPYAQKVVKICGENHGLNVMLCER